jgi:hypothetical protein
MATSCFTKSKGEKCRSVHFDISLNPEEEYRRTAHGVEVRRQRKELKQMADRNREGCVTATLNILRNEGRAAVLLRLCRSRENQVGSVLNAILNNFVPPNDRMRARLAGFRQMPRNRLDANLTPVAEMLLLALNADPTFSHAFSACFQSTACNLQIRQRQSTHNPSRDSDSGNEYSDES